MLFLLKWFPLFYNGLTVKSDTFTYCCRLLVRPDWGSSRCTWARYRSLIPKPNSPAASKLLLSWTHASMSWGVYPLCWIKRPSHSFTVDGEEQEEGMEEVRQEGSRDGPHLVKSNGESKKKERKKEMLYFFPGETSCRVRVVHLLYSLSWSNRWAGLLRICNLMIHDSTTMLSAVLSSRRLTRNKTTILHFLTGKPQKRQINIHVIHITHISGAKA